MASLGQSRQADSTDKRHSVQAAAAGARECALSAPPPRWWRLPPAARLSPGSARSRSQDSALASRRRPIEVDGPLSCDEIERPLNVRMLRIKLETKRCLLYTSPSPR